MSKRPEVTSLSASALMLAGMSEQWSDLTAKMVEVSVGLALQHHGHLKAMDGSDVYEFTIPLADISPFVEKFEVTQRVVRDDDGEPVANTFIITRRK